MHDGFYRSRIYTSKVSINPLAAASDPILTLVATLQNSIYPEDREKFLANLSHEVCAFEHHAKMANYPIDTITNARYLLCCLMDETIALTSPWGKDNGWLHNNLLSIFHQENYGGENFFAIINQTLENPTINLHLIELAYICLNLGFTGKYRNTDDGAAIITNLTSNLYQIINQHRSALADHNLFVTETTPAEPPEQPASISKYLSKTKQLIAIAIIASVLIVGASYLVINTKLNELIKPIYQTYVKN